MELSQRVALVTGASRGIGAEIARQLATDHGLLVLAGFRNLIDAEDRDGIVPVQLDVTDQGMIDAAVQRIASDPGRLDVLVNNAGSTASRSASSTTRSMTPTRSSRRTSSARGA